MSKIEGNESPPLIFSEAMKVVETLESSEDKVFYLKDMLQQKVAYLEQLEQQDYEEQKSIARKRAELSILNNSINKAQKQNLKFRNGTQKAYDSIRASYEYTNNIESDFEECEDKFEEFEKKINIQTSQYEQRIDDLTRLLDQLTEKRNEKLELLETQKKRFLDDNLDLEKQISDIEIQEKFLMNNDDDSEFEMLQNELTELQSKLTILDDDHYNLVNEEKDCERVENELTQKYPESELIELEKRFANVINKRETTIENLETEKLTESELSKSELTLEEYEAKLDKEIQETSKFWNDIEKSSYEGLTNIERDIGLIKADISERAEKYKQAKSSDEEGTEMLNQKDKDIASAKSTANDLSTELKEMDNFLNNLKTSEYFSEQCDVMTKNIEELCKEKEKLNEVSVTLEEKIQEIKENLKTETEQGELELVATENNNLMEVKKLEKDCAVAEDAKSVLENKAQAVKNELIELKQIKKNEEDRQTANEAIKKQLDAAYEKAEASMKLIETQRKELKDSCSTAPPAIYVVAHNQKFAEPHVKNISKKTSARKLSATAAKRNWDDSDSSMEAEKVKWEVLLKKKYRKGPDAGNKK